jgi:hypothetical protein
MKIKLEIIKIKLIVLKSHLSTQENKMIEKTKMKKV